MADEVEKPEEAPEPVEPETPEVPTEVPLEEKVDYEALAEARKEALEAAEALIIKNKAIARRHKTDAEEPVAEEDMPLTRKDLAEALSNFQPNREVETEESKRLSEATKRVKELEAKNSEIVRAMKAKDGAITKAPANYRDPMGGSEPKISANDAKGIKDAGYAWDGGKRMWRKKLPDGRYAQFRNLKDKEEIV